MNDFPKFTIDLSNIKPKFDIFKSPKDNQWYWNIKVGSNIIASCSEGYKNRQECLDNVFNVENRIKFLREKGLIK